MTALVSILRKPQVLSVTGYSQSSLDRAVADGLFPTPIRLSPDPSTRAIGWPESEVAKLNAARIAGFDIKATRELVQKILQERQNPTQQ